MKKVYSDDGNSVDHRFRALNQLVDWYRVNERYDEANGWVDKQIHLASKENNELEKIKALVQRGTIYKQDFEKLELIIDTISKITKRVKDPLAIAYFEYLQAFRLFHLGDVQQAVQIALNALGSVDRSEDYYIRAKLRYLLYTVYVDWHDGGKCYDYAKQSVWDAEKTGNQNLLSNAYAGLAVAYTYKYDETNKKMYLDSVLHFTQRAIDLYQEFPMQVATYTYAIARVNKASYLFRFFPELTPAIREDIEDNAAEVLRVSRTVKNGQSVVASAYGILSELARRDGDLKSAEDYLLRAYTVILSYEPIYYHTMINVVRGLSELYAEMGNYKKAYEYEQKVAEYSRKLFDENQAETTKRTEALYQFEKKEQELASMSEIANQQNKMKTLYAVLIVILIIGAFFMFRSYQDRLRYSLVREKQLNAEKHEAELKIQLAEEEKNRLKAEQELLSLREQQLQDEVLANQLHLQHKNEVLKSLKEKLSDNSAVNIQQVLREENLFDNDFENVKFRIQELHPHFFKNLTHKSKQRLTTLDLKYCAYLYLGIDTKQIANLLNVEPKSVRMTKYRLKKKFGLEEQERLEDFIKI
ncbi:hypothetical protein ACFSQ3_09860 [Sphingobacterium corticis]|uniref:HTH luxR-type domain-containing protein n=1 Tax=Sphingobacterium corticis TaxID=1812823 RepID=A0ABW5NMR2_9SPHI